MSEWCGAGKVVEIGSMHFRCLDILGRGSYSVVWRAQQVHTNGAVHPSSEAVALKEVHCSSQSSLLQAVFEVQVLLALERGIPDPEQPLQPLPQQPPRGPGCPGGVPLRVPRCIAYRVDPHQSEGWTVRTAMTVVPGESLDVFFRRPPPTPTSPTGAGRGGGSGGRRAALFRGCALARKLLLDLGPVLELLEPIAWHRDVNSHNILVDVSGDAGAPPRAALLADGDYAAAAAEADRATFWLIDFGLAVDSQSWTAAKWRTEHIGGDSRYWPPSSWIMHLLGPEGFEGGREHHREQYRHRLDVHGLGIAALELLCSVALAAEPVPPSTPATPNGMPRLISAAAIAADGEEGSWARLLFAWESYWENVWRWWSMVYSIFSKGGNIAPVQAALMQEGIIERLGELLEALRETLRQCALRMKGNGDFSTARLLRVIADMIDESCEFRLDGLEAALRGPTSTVHSHAGSRAASPGAINSPATSAASAPVTRGHVRSPPPRRVSSEVPVDNVVSGPPLRSPRGVASPKTGGALPQKQAAAVPVGRRLSAGNGGGDPLRRTARGSGASGASSPSVAGEPSPQPPRVLAATQRPASTPGRPSGGAGAGAGGVGGGGSVGGLDIGLEALAMRVRGLRGSSESDRQRLQEHFKGLEAVLQRMEEVRLERAKLSMERIALQYRPRLFAVS